MKSWTDEHFIRVQDPPISGFNKIVYKNGPEERPKGFLSYSATGSVTVSSVTETTGSTGTNSILNKFLLCVQGSVLYASYGQEGDFRLLRDKNVNMNRRVMLVRAGKISFAEKVGGF